MPRVNIYIRNEDVEKWESIEDKPEWIHFHLNKGVKVVQSLPDSSRVVLDAVEPPRTPVEFCKHSSVKGFCKKGCK